MLFQFFLNKEYYFIFSILIVLIFCIYFGVYNNKNNLLFLGKHIICISIIFFIFYLLLIFNNVSGTQYFFFNLIKIDIFTLFIQAIVIMLSILFFLLSFTFLKIGKIYSFEFYLTILISIFGFVLLVSFIDLLGIYFCIELIGICFYLLTTFNKLNIYSNEAALKYFILGSISSNFILFGISYIYISTGLTNIEEISILVAHYLVDFIEIIYYFENCAFIFNLIVAFFFILIGLFFKIYAAPFHLWISDIYQGAPLIITAFFSIVPILPFISLILRCLFYFNIFNYLWCYIFMFFGICSIVLGVLGALFQSKIKRFMAYSAISHVGYSFIFLYVYLFSNQTSIYILQLLFTYLIVYLISNVGIFCIFLNLYKIKRHNSFCLDELCLLNSLYKSNKLLSFILVVYFFSLAGLPPLPGFLGKLFLFSSIFSYNNKLLLFYLILLGAILSCFYYVRIIKIIYFNNIKNNKWNHFLTIDYTSSIVIAFVFLFLVHFFFFSEYINIFSLYIALIFI